jgi:hypothetical protein
LAFHSEREADHSPPSSAEVKEWVELYFHSPNPPPWRGAQEEHGDPLPPCIYSDSRYYAFSDTDVRFPHF